MLGTAVSKKENNCTGVFSLLQNSCLTYLPERQCTLLLSTMRCHAVAFEHHTDATSERAMKR